MNIIRKKMSGRDEKNNLSFEEKEKEKRRLQDAKSLKESMESVHAFCGLMAGFEGFIINEYVNSGGNASEQVFNAEGTEIYEERFSAVFEWGLFLLIISFSLNLAAAMMSFLWSVFLKEGLYRGWFMKVIGRTTKFMSTLGTITFCLGVLLFIETIELHDGFTITIFVLAAVLFVTIMLLFLYTMYEQWKHMKDEPADVYKIIEAVIGPIDE